MAIASVEDVLQECKNILEDHYGPRLKGLVLYGSLARGDAGSDSDIDLLVEFGRPVGLFDVFRLQHRLEDLLEVPRVDLVQRGAEHPSLRDSIHKEAINVV